MFKGPSLLILRFPRFPIAQGPDNLRFSGNGVVCSLLSQQSARWVEPASANTDTLKQRTSGGKAMAKEPTTNFPEQSAQSAMQVQNWLREMMEQNLNQTRSVLDGLLTTASKAVAGIDQQATEIRGRTMSLAQETLSNTFDFAHKLVHARQMSDLLNLQSEFFSRQAQVVAAQSKEVGESTLRGVHEVGRTASEGIETPRRGSQAA